MATEALQRIPKGVGMRKLKQKIKRDIITILEYGKDNDARAKLIMKIFKPKWLVKIESTREKE